MKHLFESCPLGCTEGLEDTEIVLPEGVLRRCRSCGQHVSACGAAWYETSMQEFNVPERTLPQGKNKKRYEQRMSKILLRAKKRVCNQGNDEPVRLLDVGCSSGALLQVAQSCGFQVYGAEPAEKAAARAAQIPEAQVFSGFLQDANYEENSFDVVTLFEVIEHLVEPVALMQEIERILKPSGVLLVGTANADSWTMRVLAEKYEYLDIHSHGGHISFFTPSSMKVLADQVGLEIVDISTKRVNFSEKKDVGAFLYHMNRIARELCALPARWLCKGQDMLVTMQKPS